VQTFTTEQISQKNKKISLFCSSSWLYFRLFLSIRRVSIRSANKKGKDLVAFPF